MITAFGFKIFSSAKYNFGFNDCSHSQERERGGVVKGKNRKGNRNRKGKGMDRSWPLDEILDAGLGRRHLPM